MTKKNDQNNLRYGFIYPVVKKMIDALHCLNAVVLFKAVAKRLAKNQEDERPFASIAIDVFVVFKWGLLAYLWTYGIDHPLATVTVFYLIGSNIFTYFYYHIWRDPYDTGDENLRRRFINLMIALAYNAVCYAYLYNIPFHQDYILTASVGPTMASAMLSVAQSLLVDFPPFAATTPTGHVVAMSQTFTVFLFITIILSASVPHFNSKNKTN